MKKLIIVAAIALMLVGCSAEKEKKVVAKNNDKVEQVKKEGQKNTENQKEKNEESKVKKLNIVDDVIGWKWEAFLNMWGEPTKEVENENGLGYQFGDFPGLTFILDQYGNSISQVIITNKDVDIYGTRIGQTQAEIKKILATEPVDGGPNELDQWVMGYQVDENLWAYYTSKAEDEAVDTILLNYWTDTNEELNSTTSSDDGSSQSNDYDSASLSADWAGVEQSGSREIPIIDVTNEGDTNATQITVRVEVYYSNESGGSSSTTQSGTLSYLSPGETGEIKILNAAAYSIDDVEIIEVEGKAK